MRINLCLSLFARRKYDTEHIAQRNKGSMGSPYNLFKLYGFDIDEDLREPGSGREDAYSS